MTVVELPVLVVEVVTVVAYRERRRRLEELVEPREGLVQLAERSEGGSAQDVIDALNTAIDRREEGLVVKDLEAPYRPGARAGGGWVKVRGIIPS